MSVAVMKETWGHIWAHLDPIKPHLDIAVVGSFVLSLFNAMPGVLTALTTITTFIWSCIRLYETNAVQTWLARRRARAETKYDPQ